MIKSMVLKAFNSPRLLNFLLLLMIDYGWKLIKMGVFNEYK